MRCNFFIKNAFVVMVAITAIGITGCKKSVSEAESPIAQHQSEISQQESPADISVNMLDNLFKNADEAYTRGETNSALTMLEDALSATEFAEQRQQIFDAYMRTLIYAGKIDDAKSRMLDTYRNNESASYTMDVVFPFYTEHGDYTNAIAWTDEVLKIEGLTTSVRDMMREWNFLSHIQANDDDEVIDIAKRLLREAPAGNAVRILQRGIETLFTLKKIQIVEAIVADAGTFITSDVQTRDMIISVRMRLLAAQKKWDALQKMAPMAVNWLQDSDLQRVLRRILSLAIKDKQTTVIDSICENVIKNYTDKPQSCAIAARLWCDSTVDTDLSKLPDRFELFIANKLRSNIICNIFIQHFYEVANDPDIVAEMKDIGERLTQMAPDEAVLGSIRTMLLDSCFILNNIDEALRILRIGIPGYDKNWHEMNISKLEAHKALEEKKPHEAIKYFRNFMALIATTEENDAMDPSTGIIHTREMILGRNAKRIGDIYSSISDTASAKAAYKEARDYYQKALNSKLDSDALDIVNKELAAIPQ